MKERLHEDNLVLIIKILGGSADLDEITRLRDWIGSSVENKQYFEQIRNIWDASDNGENRDEINTKEALQKVLERIPKVYPKRKFWYYWQKIAAIIILPLAVGTLLLIHFGSLKTNYFNDDVHNETYAAFGTRSSLRLADSSLVWLNSGSSLRYPIKFNNKTRQVFLKGEAYFEVKSDPSRPFIVKTETIQVRATGTKFNVKEYDSNPVTEVTLVSGKVYVNELDDTRNSHLISELKPDQHLEYNRATKAKSVTSSDAFRYIAWIEGKLIFRNEPLRKVLDNISLFFNTDIELQGKELQNYRYRATFQDESLEDILKLLKLSAPIDFIEVKREPLPDGSFPKKKVIIFPIKQAIYD
jgi:transmembrane sensor